MVTISGFPSLLRSATATSLLVRLADMDNDGKTDFVVAQLNGTPLNVYPNTTSLPGSSISIGSVISVSASNTIHDIAIGDLDANGTQDVALATNGNAIEIFSNAIPSLGNFEAAFQVATSHATHSVGLWDLNADGKLDLIGGYTFTKNGGVFENGHKGLSIYD